MPPEVGVVRTCPGHRRCVRPPAERPRNTGGSSGREIARPPSGSTGGTRRPPAGPRQRFRPASGPAAIPARTPSAARATCRALPGSLPDDLTGQLARDAVVLVEGEQGVRHTLRWDGEAEGLPRYPASNGLPRGCRSGGALLPVPGWADRFRRRVRSPMSLPPQMPRGSGRNRESFLPPAAEPVPIKEIPRAPGDRRGRQNPPAR